VHARHVSITELSLDIFTSGSVSNTSTCDLALDVLGLCVVWCCVLTPDMRCVVVWQVAWSWSVGFWPRAKF
jgi:hypothetical protein